MRRLTPVLALALAIALQGCGKSATSTSSSVSGGGPVAGGPPVDAREQPIPVAGGKVAFSGENSRIEFTGTKPGGKHDGGFNKFAGTAQLDPAGKQVTGVA